MGCDERRSEAARTACSAYCQLQPGCVLQVAMALKVLQASAVPIQAAAL